MDNTDIKNPFDEILKKLNVIDCIDNRNIQESYKKIYDKITEIQKVKETLLKDNSVLKIGVVGQVKAGKSSFLNSLFFGGESVLPKASTPMTAGLTVLEYSENNEFEVEYYNKKEWTIFEDNAEEYDRLIAEYKAVNPDIKSLPDDTIARMINMDMEYSAAKELVSKCSDIAKIEIQETSKVVSKPYYDLSELQSLLENYVGASGKYTPIVKCLTLKLNDNRLKDIQIVDTPGVNDPVLSREQRTREFLRACHGVFFLSYASRFFDSTDTGFLTDRIGSQGIGTVVLIASKFDSVLQDVGTQFQNRLGAAIRDCQEKLKKQFMNNLSSCDFSGSLPIFDVSSGIGFSIAQKDPSRWDSMEKHVVERMRFYYPNNFSTDENAKNSFSALSQMDVMKEKYLDGIFSANKQKIIDEKTMSYIASAGSQLSAELKKQISVLSSKKGNLENSSIADLVGKRNSMEKIVRKIKDNLQQIINISDNRTEMIEKEVFNSVHLELITNIPTIIKSENFIRNSAIWGFSKESEITYEAVNSNKLTELLKKQTSVYFSQLNNEWNKKTNELLQSLIVEMNNIVSESETQDDTGRFDADVLRNIIAETNEKLMNISTLDISKIKQDSENILTNVLTDSYRLKIMREDENEVELRNRVKEAASKKIIDTIVNVNNALSSISDKTRQLIREAREKCSATIQNSKNNIIETIEAKISAYLENLQTDLDNKEREVENYQKALEAFESILKCL